MGAGPHDLLASHPRPAPIEPPASTYQRSVRFPALARCEALRSMTGHVHQQAHDQAISAPQSELTVSWLFRNTSLWHGPVQPAVLTITACRHQPGCSPARTQPAQHRPQESHLRRHPRSGSSGQESQYRRPQIRTPPRPQAAQRLPLASSLNRVGPGGLCVSCTWTLGR